MRVGVAGQERRLEENHRDRPDRRSAAELWQHHFREHRLHGKKQQRGHEQRHRKDRGSMTKEAGQAALAAYCGFNGGHAARGTDQNGPGDA
jgi:hypothetical protein